MDCIHALKFSFDFIAITETWVDPQVVSKITVYQVIIGVMLSELTREVAVLYCT